VSSQIRFLLIREDLIWDKQKFQGFSKLLIFWGRHSFSVFGVSWLKFHLSHLSSIRYSSKQIRMRSVYSVYSNSNLIHWNWFVISTNFSIQVLWWLERVWSCWEFVLLRLALFYYSKLESLITASKAMKLKRRVRANWMKLLLDSTFALQIYRGCIFVESIAEFDGPIRPLKFTGAIYIWMIDNIHLIHPVRGCYFWLGCVM